MFLRETTPGPSGYKRKRNVLKHYLLDTFAILVLGHNLDLAIVIFIAVFDVYTVQIFVLFAGYFKVLIIDYLFIVQVPEINVERVTVRNCFALSAAALSLTRAHEKVVQACSKIACSKKWRIFKIWSNCNMKIQCHVSIFFKECATLTQQVNNYKKSRKNRNKSFLTYHLTSGRGSPRTFIWKKVFPPFWAFLSLSSDMHFGIASSSKAVKGKMFSVLHPF